MRHLGPYLPHYDAIIVGARCSGAATAMLLARKGARVLLVDWASPGTDTMSTHALMRGAVMQLNRWGVLGRIIASGTPAIRTTTFQYGSEVIPLNLKPSHGVDALYAPRRTVLDSALVNAAREAGVDIRYGVSFRDVIRNDQGRVAGAILDAHHLGTHHVSADIVIGADGRRSTVARRVEAQTERLSENAISCAYAYYEGIEDQGSHWLYSQGLGAGKIPTNNDQHCVFVGLHRARFLNQVRGENVAKQIAFIAAEIDPAFGEVIGAARLCSKPISFVGQKGHFRRSWGPGWALVGDAGYFKDPITAHGITDAFRDAEILASAVGQGTVEALTEYQRVRDSLSADLFSVTDQIASLRWSLPELQQMHLRLNDVMKQEQDWMAEKYPSPRVAA
ncbi:NAD(P)/FAD-dependent oxidoreductase [Pseudohalocynthiibacter aestuariivivens]|jgi:flavin-dependent dehydrogenase|uniref:NAD(P)/FAD-dependent oxidoreductase n=1 Tax=Pseudohalocynthiibacter aestuariivivens TaxID=1591409 RepID=A0ABV5JJQ6_9RHOB|nr:MULTISPECIES: NAD(P)/FAD-dependent oxidoreductase [Pseudohalocynthiibacter]MBS9717572.1 NAD(P)/FAD-dependent oxidoreductase [Pseudohalocynthiibacter aestuariivivens]MCK0102770.1 NAD(P)/FAD-dependent oxidoreductase [Pseudohalocynthiibacter sp. F2068]